MEVSPQAVGAGQEGDHRDDLTEAEEGEGGVFGGKPLADQVSEDRDGEMGAGGMADHEDLVEVFGQGIGDRGAKHGHARLEYGGIGAKALGGKGVVVHEVVGVKAVVGGPERAEHHQGDGKGCDGAHGGMEKGAETVEAVACEEREHQLGQQHPDGVEGRDHRALAQAHQAKERASADIGGGGADQLQIGREDALLHRTSHDVGPDENLDIRFGPRDAGDVPAIAAAGLFGLEGEGIAGNGGLSGAFGAVKLAVAPGMDRVIARNVEHKPAEGFGSGGVNRGGDWQALGHRGPSWRRNLACPWPSREGRGRGHSRAASKRTARSRRSASEGRWSRGGGP